MYPTPYIVEHSTVTVTGENALGQPVTDLVTRQRPVHGWRHKTTGDGSTAALAARVTTELYLLAPEGGWHDGDKVRLPDGQLFTVAGDVEDYNTGPFAPGVTFGFRVLLRKVHSE